jgi:hypothetical protein
MEPEVIVETMAIVSEISKLDISYPLWPNTVYKN